MSLRFAPAWIAVDWGTSRFRAWALSARDAVLATSESDDGLAEVVRRGHDFEAVLLEQIGPWLQTHRVTPVIACGMVGAATGWMEVPYETSPCTAKTRLNRVATRDSRVRVSICAGIKQERPPDVMRGEETLVSGLVGCHPDFAGTVCLPGTHSKWCDVKDGAIQNFTTYLTGELFGLLAKHSLLKEMVSGDAFDERAFVDSVVFMQTAPAAVLHELFALRAETLVRGLAPASARARLSGCLIGLEIADVRAKYDTTDITLIASQPLGPLYRLGLESLGSHVDVYEPEELVRLGLSRLFHDEIPRSS